MYLRGEGRRNTSGEWWATPSTEEPGLRLVVLLHEVVVEVLLLVDSWDKEEEEDERDKLSPSKLPL